MILEGSIKPAQKSQVVPVHRLNVHALRDPSLFTNKQTECESDSDRTDGSAGLHIQRLLRRRALLKTEQGERRRFGGLKLETSAGVKLESG